MTNVRYRFGRHALDLAKRELRRDDVPVALPARVFECLAFLIEHRERAVDRDELARAVFSRTDVSDAQLAQIILRSRRAIGDDGQEQRAIRTVPRYGFRWIAATDVETVEPAAASSTPQGIVASVVSASLPGMTSTTPLAPVDAGQTSLVHGGIVHAGIVHAGIVDAGSVPAIVAPRRRRLALVAWVVAVLALAAVATLVFLRHRPESQSPSPAVVANGAQRAIMVLPMRVEGPGDVAWARLGLMDFLVDRIRRGGLPAVSSDTTLSLLRDAGTAAVMPDVQKLRQAARVDWIVESRASTVDEHWMVRLRATDQHGLVQHGDAQGDDLLDTTRMAGDRLLAALGGDAIASDEPEPGLAERLQRAQSAMLANELDTARRILNEAPELQRSQPQLRYRLAQVDFRAGEYQRGLATLDELLAGDDAHSDALFRARLLNLRGAMLIRLDRYAEAERSYDVAIALLQRTGSPVELGHALNGRGVTHSSQGQFEDALNDLGQARVQLLRSGDALAVARVDANLGNVEMDREHPAQAIGYFKKAARDFESMGAVNELAGTSGMLASAQMQLLQPNDALAESARGWALLPRIADPAQRADVILNRAEALIAVGRVAEADRLLQLPATETVLPGDYKRRDFLRMELAYQTGDARALVRIADATLATWPVDRRPQLRLWTQVRREQGALRLDLPASARHDAVFGDDLPSRLLRALRQGAADTPAADAPAVDESYRAALALAEQRAIPGEIAEAVGAYAHWLLARGATAEAGGLVGRVAPWADQDFQLALLQVELYAKLGQREQWESALARARQLAGERPIPPDLELPPAVQGVVTR